LVTRNVRVTRLLALCESLAARGVDCFAAREILPAPHDGIGVARIDLD
jgi:hypothetical protein